MSFKPYEQNQLQIPMQWEMIIEKEHISRVLNDVVEQMKLDKILETYSPLGQSSFNPKMMLKILMYGYIKKKYSSRSIAEAVKSDIYFIWLAGGNKPTRNVINDFRKDKMKIIIEDVFAELLTILEQKGYIDLKDYFVDGTKIEANANKYTFVWKKSVEKNREKLQQKIHDLMEEIDKLNDEEDIQYPDKEETEKEEITPEEIKEFAKRLSDKLNQSQNKPKSKEEKQKDRKINKAVKQINTDYLPRLEKYNKDLEIIGNNRNSYSKTDKDATFMHMKEDHMRNGQLKPGYNVQVGTNNEFIVNWSIHQDRSDYETLIPHLERLEKLTNKLPENLGADSGYGNEKNYEYLKLRKIKTYVKYTYFHLEQKASFKKKIYNWQNMHYDEINDNFTCPEGNKLEYTFTKNEVATAGYTQEIRIYECKDCSNCSKKSECTKSQYNRKIRFNKKLWYFKNHVKRNLLSEKGLQMRANRAEYSERIFAQIKWNMDFKRFLLRGLKKVDIEWGLLSIAFNIKKMHKKDISKVEDIAKQIANSVTKFIHTKIPAISHWNFCFGGFLF